MTRTSIEKLDILLQLDFQTQVNDRETKEPSSSLSTSTRGVNQSEEKVLLQRELEVSSNSNNPNEDSVLDIDLWKTGAGQTSNSMLDEILHDCAEEIAVQIAKDIYDLGGSEKQPMLASSAAGKERTCS